MPKQLIQWQCEICGHSAPGWTEADAMECEASHVRIQQIKELHYAYPGDKYPSKITILFSDGKCQEFISNLGLEPGLPQTNNPVIQLSLDYQDRQKQKMLDLWREEMDNELADLLQTHQGRRQHAINQAKLPNPQRLGDLFIHKYVDEPPKPVTDLNLEQATDEYITVGSVVFEVVGRNGGLCWVARSEQ